MRKVVGVPVLVWLAGCGGGTLGADGGPPGTMTGAAGAAGSIIGSAGFGGGGGAGGFSGDTGFSGVGNRPVCNPIPPPVCNGVCGNGSIDSCTRSPGPECPDQSLIEECDGDSLGGETCESLGYGSGTLACATNCTQDVSACSPCLPTTAPIVSCGAEPISTDGFAAYAMTATDTEVALATTSNVIRGQTSFQTLSFARLSPGLGVVSQVMLEDTSLPGPLGDHNLWGVAAAPLPSGWVVAICADSGIYIHALDAAGTDVGRTLVSPASDVNPQCYQPVLAARPGGGPLLLWTGSTGGASMSLIASDGLSASPPTSIVDETLASVSDVPTAAWIDTSFAVAVPVDVLGDYGVALRLLRIQPDGTQQLVSDFVTGGRYVVANMAGGPDAHDVRIAYTATMSDSAGDYVEGFVLRYQGSAPTRSEMLTDFAIDANAPAVAVGDDTLVSTGYIDQRVGFVRVGQDGGIVASHQPIAVGPTVMDLALVRRGPDVIVGFHGPDARIYLARLTP